MPLNKSNSQSRLFKTQMANERANTTPQEDIDRLMIDAILDKPITFTLEDECGRARFFYIYQPSLGISLLTADILKQLQFDQQLLALNQQYEMLRLCTEQREFVLRLITIHTFARRSDALSEEKIQKRTQELQSLDAAELSTLLLAIMQWNTQQDKFIKHIGLDKEKRQREKISRVKKDSSSLTFGGRSLYGSLLDYAAERYGWELGYILWGISAINLNMMLQDSIQSVYLTDKERKQAHISTDGVYIDGSNPKNAREIQRLLRGG